MTFDIGEEIRRLDEIAKAFAEIAIDSQMNAETADKATRYLQIIADKTAQLRRMIDTETE